jgi:hypothetical protein
LRGRRPISNIIWDHFGIAKEIAAARQPEKSIDAEVRKLLLGGGGVGSLPNIKGDNIGMRHDLIQKLRQHCTVEMLQQN